MLQDNIKDRIGIVNGNVAIAYRNLTTDEFCQVGNCDMFPAAGITKLLVLIEAFKQIHEKRINKEDKYILKSKDKSPSLGVIASLHSGIELTVEDLYKLMICVSDNSALNILIDILGIDNINRTLIEYGFLKTKVRRKFFDEEAIAKGEDNVFSITEIEEILYRLYIGQIISKKISGEIIEILKTQQRIGALTYHFGFGVEVAHQTSEDNDIIHDVGIVFGEKPFILCTASNKMEYKNASLLMKDIMYICYKHTVERG